MIVVDGLKDGMIGKSGHFGTKQFFILEDSEAKFKLNCKSQTSDWIYRNEPVIYQYNSNGHRCNDLSDLPEDYFLFTGCSHTEGIGLKLEKTYPYLVSKHFKIAYYNLGLGGSGPDLTMFNLLGFLSKVKHKPKLVVIQWPHFYRFFKIKDGTSKLRVQFYQPSQQDELYKFLIKENVPYYNNLFYRKIILEHLKLHGINNIIESEYREKNNHHPDENLVKVMFNNHIDFARDLCHGGILTNEQWANSLIDSINKNFAHVI